MYRPNSLWTWAFIIITFVQAALSLGFEGYVFAKFQTALRPGASNQQGFRTIPTSLTLFIFGFLYQLALAWDALRLKNTIQVLGLCLYNIGLLLYAAVQRGQIYDSYNLLKSKNYVDDNENFWGATNGFLTALPCVLAVGTILMSFVAWKLYDEFAWSIYKHISADLRMKRRYLTFQIFIALLKFDFFFFLGFTVQFVVIIIETSDPEFWLTIAAIPVTIVILVLANYWTRRENRWGMGLIITLFFAGLAYFLFKLIRMYQPAHGWRYKTIRRPLTVFAVITLILIIITIINACACVINFGRGLKPHILNIEKERDDEKVTMTEMPNYAHGPVPSRMVID